MTTANREKLQEIFRAVFELPPTADVTGVHQVSHHNWDSLAHVSLIAAIENEFTTTIDAADALCITSYQATTALLEEKGL
jgi:acyl carrier protein